MKTYNELKKEIKTKMEEGGRRTFSKEEFNELTKAYLNDIENKTTIVRKIGDTIKEEDVFPVLEFRKKFLFNLLTDFGVDKQEAAKVITNEYKLKNTDALYPVASEIILNYLETGKKFSFLPRKDLVCSLTLHEFEEETKINKAPGKDEEIPTLYKAHKKIKAESNCPSWLKEVIK